MNTGKQINAMVAVLFVTLIAIGAYTIWDPFRSRDAEDTQLEKAADFGAHDLRAQLPPLPRRPRRRRRRPAAGWPPRCRWTPTRSRASRTASSPARRPPPSSCVTNTIMCGRVGTQMPTWGATQGGTLNEEQIRQLAVLITEGRWDLGEEHVDDTDAHMTNDATVDVELGRLLPRTRRTLSSRTPGRSRSASTSASARSGCACCRRQLEVERGVDGTEAVDHDRGTRLVDGAPSSQCAPTLRNGRSCTGGAGTLAEPPTKDARRCPSATTAASLVGDVIQIDDEHVRVTGVVTGIPSTGVVLAKEIGREPKKLLVSGAGEHRGGRPDPPRRRADGGRGHRRGGDRRRAGRRRSPRTSNVVSVGRPDVLPAQDYVSPRR